MTKNKKDTAAMVEKYSASLERGFFGFWVRKRRVTFLLIGLILIIGGSSLIAIPKESTPTISFGIISITTVYPGVAPSDIDSIITDKIEKEIDDIDGIDKINSTSSVGFSATTVTLKNDADTTQVLTDIKDKVDNLVFPSDVKKPLIKEISTDNQKIFDLVLYADGSQYSLDYLRTKARELEKKLEGKPGIASVNLGNSPEYQVSVLLDKGAVQTLGVSPSTVAQAIKTYNSNRPLGNKIVGGLHYDFSLEGEKNSIAEFGEIPIPLPSGDNVALKTIATIKGEYDDDSYQGLGFYQKTGFVYVSMTVNKQAGNNVFTASSDAKKAIEDMLKNYQFAGIQATYSNDLAANISLDYNNVAGNGAQTIVFCFIFILLFVGLKEATIASLTIPLSFLITFFVLDRMGLSLNFLTNFSLIITFGVAVDTAICIIEGTNEKIRMGYNPKSAALLAVKEFSVPLIASTMTTCIVFLPMLTLPGIIGKFLAYIPITIFVTLLGTLFVALTIPPAIYYKISSRSKYYDDSIGDDGFMSEKEKALLASDREGKTKLEHHELTLREKVLGKLNNGYVSLLSKVIATPLTRLLAFGVPLLCLIFIGFPLAGKLGMKIYPTGDEPVLFFNISTKEGSTTPMTKQYTKPIDDILSTIPEIQHYTYIVANNTISVTAELSPTEERKSKGLRDSFALEDTIINQLSGVRSEGVSLSSSVQAGGPPASKGLSISLVAESTDDLPALIKVSQDFEAYVKTLTGTKNVTNSSESSPGQFVFHFMEDQLQILGLTPNDIAPELFTLMNGVNAGNYKDSLDSYDIKVQVDDFGSGIDPSTVEGLSINTRRGVVQLGSVMDYQFTNAVSKISREDGKIQIKIEADLNQGVTSDKVNPSLLSFADSYKFPAGVHYEQQNSSDTELVTAAGISFLIAMLLIFSILVLTFNSFLQPVIAFYSVFMSLLGVFIGLYITGNPLSMAFAIGFIALTGVVVTDAIVFIDRVNENLHRGMDTKKAILETGRSRIQPIILNTSSAVLGSIGTAQQDPFFAGLGYTIIFGLLVASLMTLFVIPALYYQKPTLMMAIKRSILSLVLYLMMPLCLVGAIIIGLYGIGVTVNLSSPYVSGCIFIVLALFFILYFVHIVKRRSTTGQTFIQQRLGLRVVNLDGTILSKTQALKRLLMQCMMFPGAPIIVGSIVGGLFIGSVPTGIMMVSFVVLTVHFCSLWLSPDNQTMHDRIAGTKVVNTRE